MKKIAYMIGIVASILGMHEIINFVGLPQMSGVAPHLQFIYGFMILFFLTCEVLLTRALMGKLSEREKWVAVLVSMISVRILERETPMLLYARLFPILVYLAFCLVFANTRQDCMKIPK